MSFTDIYQISGSAMTAQTIRLNTVASNLANANAPAGSEAQAYKGVCGGVSPQLAGGNASSCH